MRIMKYKCINTQSTKKLCTESMHKIPLKVIIDVVLFHVIILHRNYNRIFIKFEFLEHHILY